MKSKYNNCHKLNNTKPLEINSFTRMKYDKCANNKDYQEDIGPGNYMLSNFHSCICNAPDAKKVSLSQPKVYIKDGLGWGGMNGCSIDTDSKLRLTEGNKLTCHKSRKQLFTRPYLSVPYMGKGIGNPCLEPIIKPGEDTSQGKACNVLSGNTRNNNFIPLLPCIRDNIQKPEHLIPDAALDGWVRGGLPSRQIVRNIEYMGKCGELYNH